MSKQDEIEVSKLIEANLSLRFQNRPYKIGDWGKVDNWCTLDENTYLFLEVETSQKHPNTNVLKLWPYLLEHVEMRVILIQSYFSDSPGVKSNRGRLAEWLGIELENQLFNRFKYCRIIIDKTIKWAVIRNEVDQFLHIENQ